MEFTYSARADRRCRREIMNPNKAAFARLVTKDNQVRTCPAGETRLRGSG